MNLRISTLLKMNRQYAHIVSNNVSNIGVSPSGKASGADICRFESNHPSHMEQSLLEVCQEHPWL